MEDNNAYANFDVYNNIATNKIVIIIEKPLKNKNCIFFGVIAVTKLSVHYAFEQL